jgi:mannan endo-1,4-beta-mannosidase
MLLLALLVVSLSFILPTNAAAGFVSRCGTSFCLDGKKFYFAGANTYDVFTYGDGWNVATPALIESNFMDKARIDAHFANLQKDGVSVLRLWMFSHETWHGFEQQKGVYYEPQFMLFDYVIQSAKAHNIKLVATMENFWEAYGGIDTRLSWEGQPNGLANRWRFFNRDTCPGCFDQYKNYAKYVLNRVNHYSNITYKNEPTIFAWELMNEPRYQDATPNENSSGKTLRAWVDEMGQFIKSIDTNHMVGTGIEGHGVKYGYGGDEGNPFVFIHQSPYVDFTSAHPYPTEGWANLNLTQTRTLIKAWIDDSHTAVGKPFYLGEFNTAGVDRSTWWKGIYDEMEQSDGNGDTFWWYMSQNTDGEYGVMAGYPELSVFRQHTATMQNKNN